MYPSEKSSFADPLTGRRVIQWTCSPAKDQHLYFTSHSVTADDRWLLFLSERDGHPNLCAIDRASGEIHPVSRNAAGLLHAYVYPYGGPTGLSKASPSLDTDRNRIYWIQDDALWVCQLGAKAPEAPRRLCPLPPDCWSAFTHVSPDGRTVCVPVSDAAAFDPAMKSQWSQMVDTVARFRAGGLNSYILLINTATGACETRAVVPFWVTHVQFDPEGSGRILFCMEGGAPVRPRMWCLEIDGGFHPLYDPDSEGVDYDTHENWDPRGGAIVYHGEIKGQPFVAARRWNGELVYRHFLPPEMKFMHATLSTDGSRLLIDQRNGVVSQADPATGEVKPLCRHDSSAREQDCHVHPFTTPSGRSVVFTSDRGGSVNVYETPLDGPASTGDGDP